MTRRSGLTVVLLALAACGPPDLETLTDRDDLIRVVRTPRSGDSVLVTVRARGSAVQLNAKAPPRLVGRDGAERLLGGPVDAAGEKFIDSASAVVPRSAGILHVSICDSVLGICRKTTVRLDA